MRLPIAKRAMILIVTLTSTLFLGGCGFKGIALGLVSDFLNGGSTVTSLIDSVTGSTST